MLLTFVLSWYREYHLPMAENQKKKKKKKKNLKIFGCARLKVRQIFISYFVPCKSCQLLFICYDNEIQCLTDC